jgi:hypothetical protein
MIASKGQPEKGSQQGTTRTWLAEQDRQTGQVELDGGTGLTEQDCQDRTAARRRQSCQDIKERIARKEQPEHDSQHGTARTGQPERDSQNGTARTGQPERDSQNGTGRTGQPEKDRHNNQDKTARTGLPRQGAARIGLLARSC